MRCTKNSSRREVHSDSQKQKKKKEVSENNLTLHLKELEKEEQTKLKISRRKDIKISRTEMENKKSEQNRQHSS